MLVAIAGCSGDSVSPITSCENQPGFAVDCRFQNPEDLALLEDGETVLVSQYGMMDGSRPGNLASYSLSDGTIRHLFPTIHVDDRTWGDEDCGPPDAGTFSPHGIDLETRDDGDLMLLVVNHGSREAVEFFQVLDAGPAVNLMWRGCTMGPDQAFFNDVVAKTEGGFWVTHMMPKDAQLSAMFKSIFGADTGFVYEWKQDSGFSKVEGSDGPFPNGIEKAQDESALFINMYLGGEVRKLNLATGKIDGATPASNPDNSSWSSKGTLLVASHTDSFSETMACNNLEQGTCGFEFEIVEIDPSDMSRSTRFKHRGAPMGGVTVAIEAGDELIFGTYAGNRIGRTSPE